MSKHKISFSELRTKLQSLQDQFNQEEQKLNGEIGAWVRQQTNVDSLEDFKNNFIIIPQKNKQQAEKVPEKIPTASPSNFPTGQKKQSAPPMNFQNVAQQSKSQTQSDEDIFF